MVERLRRARRPWRNVAGGVFVFVAEVVVVVAVIVVALVVAAVMQVIF
jgi:hypothetical protein